MVKRFENEEKNKVCQTCGKQNGSGSSGSITAWIFRGLRCACNTAKSKGVAVKMPPESLKLRVGDLEKNADGESAAKRSPSPSEQAFLGKIINQKYHITGFIGRGGMSVVYRARDLVMDRDVAIKVLNSQLAADESALKRFRIEAQAVNALNSKNIVKLYDFDMTEDFQPYLVVELLVGSSLAETVKSCPEGVPPDVAIGWFCQIASALEEAHYQGVIHRDIKPSNIAINQNDVKIFDFGIAKVFFGESGHQSKLTQTGEIFGSPIYMSPEQCRGEKLNGRSDIYSLGTLMYEVISGAPPFPGHSMLDTMSKQIDESPRPLREVAPNISEGLEYVIMRCLEKEQTMRYQTAKDLLTDLQHVQAHRKIPNMMRRKTSNAGIPITVRGLKMPEGSIKENFKMASVIVTFFFLLSFGVTAGLTWSSIVQIPMPDESGFMRMLARDSISSENYKAAAQFLTYLFTRESITDKKEIAQSLGYCLHKMGNLRSAFWLYNKYGVYPNDKAAFEQSCERARHDKFSWDNDPDTLPSTPEVEALTPGGQL